MIAPVSAMVWPFSVMTVTFQADGSPSVRAARAWSPCHVRSASPRSELQLLEQPEDALRTRIIQMVYGDHQQPLDWSERWQHHARGRNHRYRRDYAGKIPAARTASGGGRRWCGCISRPRSVTRTTTRARLETMMCPIRIGVIVPLNWRAMKPPMIAAAKDEANPITAAPDRRARPRAPWRSRCSSGPENRS